ncbi:hypothetical protein DKP78_18970, partial [Enterococcus faecium]
DQPLHRWACKCHTKQPPFSCVEKRRVKQAPGPISHTAGAGTQSNPWLMHVSTADSSQVLHIQVLKSPLPQLIHANESWTVQCPSWSKSNM